MVLQHILCKLAGFDRLKFLSDMDFGCPKLKKQRSKREKAPKTIYSKVFSTVEILIQHKKSGRTITINSESDLVVVTEVQE